MELQEANRISAVLLLMTGREARGFLFNLRRYYRGFTNDFANALGIEKSRFEISTINRIDAHFDALRAAQLPKFQCMGCGALADAVGLRWDKLNHGEAVTVSVDHSSKPDALSWLTSDVIMEQWFAPWSENNQKIKFRLLSQGVGDCRVKWAPVDGPGNTLKFVWAPRDGIEMDNGDSNVGDMVCDNSESSYPRHLVNEAGEHEVGHVLGIGHLEAVSDVMYPYAYGYRKSLSINDLRERDTRYPI